MYESGQYRPPAGHDDNNDFFDDDGTRDGPVKTVALGMLAPALILVWAGWIVVSGEVVLYGDRRPPMVFDGFWTVGGAATCLVGVAGIFAAWYGVANVPRWEQWYFPLAYTAAGVAILGVVVFGVGGFFDV